MSRTTHYSLCIALTLFGAGCPLLDLEVEVPAICVDVEGVSIPGSDEEAHATGVVEVIETVDISEHVHAIRDALTAQGVSETVHVTSFSATIVPSADGPHDFSFVESMQVTMRDASPVT